MAKPEINISPEQYEKFLAEEGERIDSYINNYYSKYKVPKPIAPTKERLSFWNLAGLESSIFVLSGLGGAILSSVRTGGLFFLMEVLLVKKYNLPDIFGTTAGIIALITSLLAFEGTLIGIGLVKGKESGKIKISTISLVVSLLTVILASVFSSFTIVEVSTEAQLYMDISLAIITGLASSITTYLSFENVGFIRNDVNVKREEINKTFSKDYKIWEEGAIASYNVTRKNITNRAMSDYVQTETISTPAEKINTDQRKLSKSEKAYNYIQKYFTDHGKLPSTIQAVVDGASVAMGTAYAAMTDFKVNNREELLFKNLITPEEIGTLMLKKGKPAEVKISEFIEVNGKFPMAEDQTLMGITTQQAAKYVADNREDIRSRNLLSEDIIEKAIAEVK